MERFKFEIKFIMFKAKRALLKFERFCQILADKYF